MIDDYLNYSQMNLHLAVQLATASHENKFLSLICKEPVPGAMPRLRRGNREKTLSQRSLPNTRFSNNQTARLRTSLTKQEHSQVKLAMQP